MEKGCIQVYTGDGKGKTTAAIGLSIRALGAGLRVYFAQFMKVPTASEHQILRQFAPQLVLETWGKPCFIARREELSTELMQAWEKSCVIFEKGHPPADYQKLLAQGLAAAAQAMRSGQYDLVVLDELNMAMHFELLSCEEVLLVLEKRCPTTEVVITGRHCPEALLQRADLVTEMREIKHYYQIGVEARTGIEN